MRSARKILAGVLASTGLAAADAAAVYLNGDGLGQALIYPYYTVRSSAGNPYHTYIAVTNTGLSGSVMRVRLREGRNGREVAGFNLFLAAGDMWTAAVVPEGEGARILSADRSCTEPAFSGSEPTRLALHAGGYTGANADNLGDGLDRTREGYVEVIEMAGVRDGSPTAAAISGSANCVFVRTATNVAADLEAPRGRLMGSLTLINVASGLDATVNADALADISSRHFFRPSGDAYPDFDALEVTPVSVIAAGGKRYRLAWARGVDAVSSVLMQASSVNEYVLDNNADSLSDWIVTMPTRRFYRTTTTATAPFEADSRRPGCDRFDFVSFDRDSRRHRRDDGGGFILPPAISHPTLCFGATVGTVLNESDHMRPLLGSANSPVSGEFGVSEAFQNGWAQLAYIAPAAATQGLASLATSTATELASGVTVTGAFRVQGLPVVGFMMRTFNNGTLTCASARCQGNYAAAFPHRGLRGVVPAP